MSTAYINRIATAVPDHDVHATFLAFASHSSMTVARRFYGAWPTGAGSSIASLALRPGPDPVNGAVDADNVYGRGAFPTTAARMRLFEAHAPALAARTVEKLCLGEDRSDITHLLVTCCTGFSAPGPRPGDRRALRAEQPVERTIVGFMGCYAAINALKLARHIVRSEASAKVLVLNLELCTLHLKETGDLEQILSFMVFADGCSASLVSSEPTGLALDSFHAVLAPGTRDLITWSIREFGASVDPASTWSCPAKCRRRSRTR